MGRGADARQCIAAIWSLARVISMSLPETIIAETSIASPAGEPGVAGHPGLAEHPDYVGHPGHAGHRGVAGHAGVEADRRHAMGLRAWLLTAALFLVPVAAYWPTTFHDFGLRDDYSNLREAHEELGKVVQFCASHARPIYGWLLQATYGQTTSVHNLQWMRLLASVLLGSLALVIYRGLRALGWSSSSSLCVAVLVSLVPAS